MDFAPSLPPTSPNIPSPSSIITVFCVEALVILAAIAMFLLHGLGSLRRRSGNGLLHEIVDAVDTLAYPLVAYTIGLMKSSDWYYIDFTVWAVFLLLLLGSTDSLTACRLDHMDNWKSTYQKLLFKAFMVVFILVKFGGTKDVRYLWLPLAAMLSLGVVKVYVRIASMRMVSKHCLGKNVKVIHDYMKDEDYQVMSYDPVTMQGYRYMVGGEKHWAKCLAAKLNQTKNKVKPSRKGITTVEQIWQSTGNLLRGDNKQGMLRKDVCLSMALSKMLNRRFAGFKLPEVELEKSRDLVFRGLLSTAGDKKPHERAFRVIEEELVFVHDLYYTRYSYLYQKGRYFALCLPVLMITICIWLTHLIVESKYPKQEDEQQTNDQRSDCQGVTIFITVVLALLDLYQLLLFVASGWFKVALIRSYVSLPSWQRGCCQRPLEILLDGLLRFKIIRPWKGSLGQYCIIQKHGPKARFIRNCLHYVTLGLVGKANSPVKLSEDVKRAVVDSLLRSNGDLTNGVTSLRDNGVHGHLSWACDATDGTVTSTILVWHIATTLCYWKQQVGKATEDQGAVKTTVKTASTLSQYCMHLLVCSPNLLPDHSTSISEPILKDATKQVDTFLKTMQYKKHEQQAMIKETDTIGEVIQLYGGGDEPTILSQGAKLAWHLITDIHDPALRWKVLSDFWAEMMLFVSPSDDGRAHLEALAKGGEFITHLWALLTHAGVLKRGPAGPKDVV